MLGIRFAFLLILCQIFLVFRCDGIKDSCITDEGCHPKPKRVSAKVKMPLHSASDKERPTGNNPGPSEDKHYHGDTGNNLKPSSRFSRNFEQEQNPEFWHAWSKETLEEALKRQKLNRNVAKNTIIFLGDGMGVQTITAGRILKGQLRGESGEESILGMDTLPFVGLSKTYSVDHQTADSAATANAFLCGVKSRNNCVGVNGQTVYDDCTTVAGNEVESVLKKSFREGKSVGIVTTTRLNHATPSATYAHSANRNWYGDRYMSATEKEQGCKDLALQLYENLPMLTVAFGGGRKYLRPETVADEEYESEMYTRRDGQDLITKWEQSMEAAGKNAQYVWNKSQFESIDPDTVDHALGIFEPSDMQFEADRDKTMEPSLAEMTRKAIEILQRNENGYYLLVEGGRIDHAHHDTNAYRALHDLVAFDDAVEVGLSLTSEEDTLIVVTADHGHTFNLGQYSLRGNPIFGLAPSHDDPARADLDFKNYTSLSYGNGEGYQGTAYQGDNPDYDRIVRESPQAEQVLDKDYLQQTAVPLEVETHGGDDVVIMARGPLAHLVQGVHEQTYVAHLMSYATCVGDNKEHCDEVARDTTDAPVVVYEVDFLGYSLSSGEAEAALNAMFSLEIIFSVLIVAFCGGHFYKRRKLA